MASLLEKVRTLISANLHAIVDAALKSNSIAVVDQYIRQIEDSLEDLEDATATVGGQVKTLRRKLDEYSTKADELDRNIDFFLKDGKDEVAAAAQSKLNSTQRLVDNYAEQLARQEKEFEVLQNARLKQKKDIFHKTGEAHFSIFRQKSFVIAIAPFYTP